MKKGSHRQKAAEAREIAHQGQRAESQSSVEIKLRAHPDRRQGVHDAAERPATQEIRARDLLLEEANRKSRLRPSPQDIPGPQPPQKIPHRQHVDAVVAAPSLLL